MEDDPELGEDLERITGAKDRPRYELVRFALLRGMGFVYAFAFLGATQQLPALIGPGGLLPAELWLERVTFADYPSLFFLTGASDAALLTVAWLGFALGVLVLLGLTNAFVMAALWVLQLSVLHVGQIFYGYGWEILLAEAGFLAIFLCPWRSVRPLPRERAPWQMVWLYRWLAFRVMFGAGLIKIRGDACWRELTCLTTHYETQPIPNPLSWLFHHAPLWFHQAGVLFNHFVELIVPFMLLMPRPVRYAGAAFTIGFQGTLILSGNLSFLNWLTIVVSLAAFDDRSFERIFRRPSPETEEPSKARRILSWSLLVIVAFLSVNPVMNMLSFDQRMNMSFDRLHLVNTYGAFGSVNRVRHEVIVEGTADDPEDPDARWLEYEFPCKPGDPDRAPCVRAPYHYRLDWQLWFAAMSDYERQPWIVHLVDQLLQGEDEVKSLIEHDPFPDRPPRAVRVSLYRYEFTDWGEEGWWRRERVGDYLHPLTADDPGLRDFCESYGWD